jgi:phosphotriesterase-related protein
MKRRGFLSALAGTVASPLVGRAEGGRPGTAPATTAIQTVRGPIAPADMGVTLVHEHVLVDFVGADRVSRSRYDADEVFRSVLPRLAELKQRGCRTLVECTPAFLGRDPLLLRRLSAASGLHLLTNTGYYGAGDDRFLPEHALRETARQLADRWTAEARAGIEGTGVRPAFLKIGVDAGMLSPIDRKLVEAASLCHLDTGLTIAVHTGDGTAALEILALLERARVSPEAWIWVHAGNAKDRATHDWAARQGAWIEFDGLSPATLAEHVEAVADLTQRGRLDRLLVSQDAGWYHVGEPGGGSYRPHVFLFDTFIPALRARGLGDATVRALLLDNPARALAPRVKRAG